MAGAFGLPQFLPSAFLRFAVDGNRNGDISLYDEVDAIWSTSKYLGSFGYRDDISLKEKRAILWRYNKSDAYIDTILSVSRGIKASLRRSAGPSIKRK
jgi:membrane-bound lytic murein transglycosylase B